MLKIKVDFPFTRNSVTIEISMTLFDFFGSFQFNFFNLHQLNNRYYLIELMQCEKNS